MPSPLSCGKMSKKWGETMIDVEKRAHDLAIAYVAGKVAANKKDMDIAAEYMECYNLALKFMLKNFPDEK